MRRILLCVSILGGACNDASPAGAREPATAERRAARRDAGRRPEAPAGPRVVLEGPDGPVAVRVEVAKDPRTRARGLMERRRMDEDAGMIFLFERSEVQTFWMRNTYLPLDMIFIGPDMRVAGIVEDAEPLTDTSRSVDLPSRYVLEVNAGWSRRHGIGPGTPVRFEGVR